MVLLESKLSSNKKKKEIGIDDNEQSCLVEMQWIWYDKKTKLLITRQQTNVTSACVLITVAVKLTIKAI